MEGGNKGEAEGGERVRKRRRNGGGRGGKVRKKDKRRKDEREGEGGDKACTATIDCCITHVVDGDTSHSQLVHSSLTTGCVTCRDNST